VETEVAARSSTAAGHEALVLLLVGLWAGQRQEIERLREERGELKEANGALVAECEGLKERVHELSRRLDLDSHTSSKPPSSDGLKRKRRTAISPERERRKRLARGPGKQKGAPGRHLEPVAEPDEMIELLPAICGCCGRDLDDDAVETGMERRQVLDLPRPPGLLATEYRALKLRCAGCGQVTRAAFPGWAKGPVSYGPRLHAAVGYLGICQHLPYERMRELLHEVAGAKVSAGALVQMVARAGERVGPAVETIRHQLREAGVLHLDETGAHVSGKLKWVHGAATDRLTLLGIADHRGGQGIASLGVSTELRGIAIHDHWSCYWGEALPKVVGHGLCNAHHLRELAAVTELDGQRWSGRMSNLLLEMLAARNQAMEKSRGQLEPELVAAFKRRYGNVIREGQRENPSKAGRRRSKAANLLRRLDQHRIEVLRFLDDFRVPFTNNEVERDLRMNKLHEKISGGWRSMEGARAFLAVRSYLATARKQGKGMLEVLVAAFEGQLWLPATAGP
jgi:transposase